MKGEFQAAISKWFLKEGRDLPWRRTRDPYAILVSEIMLQQTQVVTVLDYYRRWMERFPDAEHLAGAPEPEVLHAWQGLGYYSRARNLHKAARQITEKHKGVFPQELEAIRNLPGVGRYTAGAVATFAFDQSTPIVDANIARVLARLFDVRVAIDSTLGQQIIWEQAETLVPKKNARIFNSAIMELGALVCLPRQPKCLLCPVKKFCRATKPEELPLKKPRRKTEYVLEQCAWIQKNGSVLLQQGDGNRWRGLWRFPKLTVSKSGKPAVELDYPITHHKVTLQLFKVSSMKNDEGQWFKMGELEKIPMPSPHRRALEQILKTL